MSLLDLNMFHKQLHDLFVQAAIKLSSSPNRNAILDHIQTAMEIIEQQIALQRERAN